MLFNRLLRLTMQKYELHNLRIDEIFIREVYKKRSLKNQIIQGKSVIMGHPKQTQIRRCAYHSEVSQQKMKLGKSHNYI